MDGFKTLPKMQSFKTGGSVKSEAYCGGGKTKMKEGGEVEVAKKVVKKGFKLHDDQLHDGEKTDLSGLKKGGRAKKAMGTVKKYKSGGEVKVAPTGDKKATAPSKASEKPAFKGSDVAKTNKLPAGSSKAKKVSEGPKEADASSGAKGGPNKYKKGGEVKKMATGGPSFASNPEAAQDALDTADNIRTRNMIMDPARRVKSYLAGKLAGLNPMNTAAAGVGAPAPAPAAAAPMPAPQGAPMPAQKKGGKVKGKC